MDSLNELSKDRLVVIATEQKELAQVYADRVIEIEFGKIISDTIIKKKKIKGSLIELTKDTENTKNIPNLSVLQLGKRIVGLMLFTLSLTLVLSFLGSFFALRDFDLNQTMAYTMEQNESYIVPLQKYQERAYTFGWPFIVRAGTHAIDDVSLNYISGIRGKTGNLFPVYPAYYFNKSIQD
ncbi:MAG: hypothetical protein RG740_06375, partial [Acholeplasmataceae bacterium]|nr:hypothetical protein [Acholeplasmataceae bacterium]